MSGKYKERENQKDYSHQFHFVPRANFLEFTTRLLEFYRHRRVWSQLLASETLSLAPISWCGRPVKAEIPK